MTKPTVLIVEDRGDPSVGIFSQSFQIPCPFFKNDVEPDALEYFRDKIEELYGEFTERRVICQYDFECMEPDLPEEVENLIQDAKDLAIFGT